MVCFQPFQPFPDNGGESWRRGVSRTALQSLESIHHHLCESMAVRKHSCESCGIVVATWTRGQKTLTSLTSWKTRTVCQYKWLYIVLANQNLPLPVQNEKIIYWQRKCFCTGTEQDLKHTGKTGYTGKTIKIFVCQYIKKTDYTGKPCVLYTGTEQYLKHTTCKTKYTGKPINIILCQYIKKIDYTGKSCVLYTGTEQYLKHTGKTEYTAKPIKIILCQYIKKTDYTGKPCVLYTGTEQDLKHTGKTEYTGRRIKIILCQYMTKTEYTDKSRVEINPSRDF